MLEDWTQKIVEDFFSDKVKYCKNHNAIVERAARHMFARVMFPVTGIWVLLTDCKSIL